MKIHYPLILFVLLLALASCNTTMTLEENEYLHRKNIVKFTDKNPGIDLDDVKSILQPRPNKRFIGFIPIKIWFYNLGSKRNPTKKIRTWMRERAGEIPVLYDSLQVKNSLVEVRQYLKKVGYSEPAITARTKSKNQRTRTTYTISPGEPYRIRNFVYEISDTTLNSFVIQTRKNSKITEGSIFNAFVMDNERSKITSFLRNNGYYFFDRNFIYFEIDSSLNSHQMDLFLKIKDNQVSTDSLTGEVMTEPHKRYYVNKIFINPNYDPMVKDYSLYDTAHLIINESSKKIPESHYFILYKEKLRVQPKIISQSIFITSGEPFKALDVRKTQLRFRELGLFNYTNILFKKVPEDTIASIGAMPLPLLDCNINLTKKKLHSFTIEGEGTNKSGKLGIGGNFTYQNNNIFRGSEIFRARIRGSLEFQKNLLKSSDSEERPDDYSIFSTIETGGEISVTFPKFLAPVRQERFPKYFKPTTTIRLGLSWEKRPQYTRYINTLSFGYDWIESETKSHLLYPITVNVVDVSVEPEYQEIIDDEPNDRIRNQYTDHLILGISYSFIYNNQKINTLKNFIYFRTNVETAGNLLNLMRNPLGGSQDSSGYYELFGIRYSQYAKGDVDFRYYSVITKDNSFVFRIYLGLGVPYGNSDVLPLEKGFYAGGANGMRGWPLRLLGPGGYSDREDYFDRMGDMQIETNLEYRFPIYRWFKGSIFADVGNIWLLQPNSSYPEGAFHIDTFISQLGFDAGFGFRFDFDFFILRLDAALKVRDPAMPSDERWVLGKSQFGDILWNLGIGYPF